MLRMVLWHGWVTLWQARVTLQQVLLMLSEPGYHRSMTQPRPRVPLSRQIAADLRERIGRGELKTGDQLPSVVRLAETYNVATGTVQKALRILKREGLIESEPAYGTFVR